MGRVGRIARGALLFGPANDVVHKGVWVRAYWLVAVVAVLGIVLVSVDEKSGVAEWQRLRSELALSEERIEALSTRSDSLRREIAELQEDPFAVERAIREELALVRPGERLVRFTGDGSGR